MENYRKIYEKKCNIKIPKNYEIHHVDFNRENNNIRNLVMLPKEIHQEYHKAYEELNSFYIQKEIISIIDKGNGINEIYKNKYEKFIRIWEECCKYANYRDFCLGLIPNFSGINEGKICKK